MHHRVAGGAQNVLQLHRLDHQHGIALLDLLAFLHMQRDQLAVEGGAQRLRRLGAGPCAGCAVALVGEPQLMAFGALQLHMPALDRARAGHSVGLPMATVQRDVQGLAAAVYTRLVCGVAHLDANLPLPQLLQAQRQDFITQAHAHRPRERAGHGGGGCLVGIQHSQHGHAACVAWGLQTFANSIGLLGQKRNQSFACCKRGVLQTSGQKSPVGRQAQQRGLVQACAQLVDGLAACGRVGDQLAQHRIVVRRDHRTHMQRMVKAQAFGRCKGLHRAGLRREVFVFGAQAHFNRVALQAHIGLRQRQRFAACDAQLPLDQVKAREHFGDGVLHLQAGVHLHQIEGLVGLCFVQQKLHRARAHIARRLRQRNGCLPELRAECSVYSRAG